MLKKSSTATAYRNAKKIGRELYESGITDVKLIARNVGVEPRTVSRWIKKESWNTKNEEIKDLQKKIEKAADQLLFVAMQEYTKDPANKDLQSLRGLLREYMERKKPDKRLLEHIIKFQEDVIEFCMQTGNDVLRKHYQASLLDLSEFLREKYV